MTLIEAQYRTTQARLILRHAEVVSGAYKFRQIGTGTITSPGPDVDDEGKLKYVLGIMERHVERLQEIEDYIGEHQDDGV